MTPVLDNESGVIVLNDSTSGYEVARIPHGVAVDSADDPMTCFDVEYKLEQTKNNSDTWQISVIVDKEYLADPARVYPVCIDPTITYHGEATNTWDTFISEGQPNSTFGGLSHMWVGTHPTYQSCQALIKFRQPDLEYGAPVIVQDAKFRLYALENTNSTTHHVHRIVQNWSSGSATWNNCTSGFTSDVYTQKTVSGTGWQEFSVTSMVQKWYFNKVNYYGLLVTTNNNTTGAYTKYASSDYGNAGNSYRPQLVVTYTPLPSVVSSFSATGYGNEPSTGTGYIQCNWQKISGIDGYKVLLFSGSDYEEHAWESVANINNTNTTSWSSHGKHLYNGGELSCDAKDWYDYRGYPTGSIINKYKVRIYAYVDDLWGAVSNEQWVQIPDTVPPSVVPIFNVTIDDTGTPNSSSSTTASITYNEINDLPYGMQSGIKRYEIERRIYNPVNPDIGWTDTQQVLPGAEQPILYENLLDGNFHQFRIRAIDNNNNNGAWKVSDVIQTTDRTPPNIENAVISISPSGWTDEFQPTISWNDVEDISGIENIGWRIYNEDSNTSYVWDSSEGQDGSWVDISASTNDWMYIPLAEVGYSGDYMLPAFLAAIDDGDWYVELRFEDQQGNFVEIQNTNSVLYQKDTIAPAAIIHGLYDENVLKGNQDIVITADDLNLDNWYITLSRIDGTGSQQLAYGEAGVIEETVCTLETTELDNNKQYYLTLHVKDKADVTTTKQVMFAIDQNMQSQAPQIILVNPQANSFLEDEADPNVDVVWQSPLGTSNEHLYINGEVYPLSGLQEIDLADFRDGSLLSLHVIGLDENLAPIYSQETMTRQSYEQTFNNMDGIYDLINTGLDIDEEGDFVRLQSNENGVYTGSGIVKLDNWRISWYIMGFALFVEDEKPEGTDIQYKYSIDGGNTWINVTPGEEIDLSKWHKSIMVEAVLSGDCTVTPKVRDIALSVKMIRDEHKVTVDLVQSPQNLNIERQINYQNILRWDGVSEHEGYNIYRAPVDEHTTHAEIETMPMADFTLLASEVQDEWYADLNLHYGQQFAYRVTALQTLVGETTPQESGGSQTCVKTCPSQQAIERNLGLETDWGTAAFPIGPESGHINLLNGNLSYSTTDLVRTGRLFALVMRRTYNHQAETDSLLGPQWDFHLTPVCCVIKILTNLVRNMK